MGATIVALRRYPLKGAASVIEQELPVNMIVGVERDRSMALRKIRGDLTKRPERLNKRIFVAGAHTPGIAAEPAPRGGSDEDPGYWSDLVERYGNKDYFELQDTRGTYHLCDTAGPMVSILNLETLRAFERFSGMPMNPERFRMNVWIDGLPAHHEYDWVDRFPGTREIMAGGIRMRIDDACERCQSPDANPDTGEYDMNIRAALARFMEERTYVSPQRGVRHVMGIYGVVLNAGTLRIGDNISLI